MKRIACVTGIFLLLCLWVSSCGLDEGDDDQGNEFEETDKKDACEFLVYDPLTACCVHENYDRIENYMKCTLEWDDGFVECLYDCTGGKTNYSEDPEYYFDETYDIGSSPSCNEFNQCRQNCIDQY